MSLSTRLREALTLRKMKQSELCARTGIGKSSISTYLTGAYEPKQRNIQKMAEALNVNERWLLGEDVPMERRPDIYSIPGILPLPETKIIPLLGTIACGEPLLAEENIEELLRIPSNIDAHFALRCKGDSMTGARIMDGDIVYIREQPEVENGQIAAVLIDGNATLKRVYYHPNLLILHPENPAYPEIIYRDAELEQVKILGRAVSFTSPVK